MTSRCETAVPITSEHIEPFAAMWVGLMFARCAEARDDRTEYRDALNRLWFGLYGLERIAIATSTATHFSIAMNNHIRDIANFIQQEIGVDPVTDPSWSWRRS